MAKHAIEREKSLNKFYSPAKLTKEQIRAIIKNAGILPDGNPNYRTLERLIHKELKAQKDAKSKYGPTVSTPTKSKPKVPYKVAVPGGGSAVPPEPEDVPI